MIINFEKLKDLQDRNTIICSGWFDMLHIGHLNFLKNAKKHADNLVVVVMNDRDGKYIKGNDRPIINQFQRAEIIDSLKCVDYTIISKNIKNKTPYFNSSIDKKGILLWNRYIPIIKELNPNKVFSLEETLKFNGLGDYIENLSIDVVYSKRTNGISTTSIENKLKAIYTYK